MIIERIYVEILDGCLAPVKHSQVLALKALSLPLKELKTYTRPYPPDLLGSQGHLALLTLQMTSSQLPFPGTMR